jgi:hypothetical protein
LIRAGCSVEDACWVLVVTARAVERVRPSTTPEL